jgi:hypothetical protein
LGWVVFVQPSPFSLFFFFFCCDIDAHLSSYEKAVTRSDSLKANERAYKRAYERAYERSV